jgi:hypothetical protein
MYSITLFTKSQCFRLHISIFADSAILERLEHVFVRPARTADSAILATPTTVIAIFGERGAVARVAPPMTDLIVARTTQVVDGAFVVVVFVAVVTVEHNYSITVSRCRLAISSN